MQYQNKHKITNQKKRNKGTAANIEQNAKPNKKQKQETNSIIDGIGNVYNKQKIKMRKNRERKEKKVCGD